MFRKHAVATLVALSLMTGGAQAAAGPANQAKATTEPIAAHASEPITVDATVWINGVVRPRVTMYDQFRTNSAPAQVSFSGTVGRAIWWGEHGWSNGTWTLGCESGTTSSTRA